MQAECDKQKDSKNDLNQHIEQPVKLDNKYVMGIL